jgi:hypothetical protein
MLEPLPQDAMARGVIVLAHRRPRRFYLAEEGLGAPKLHFRMLSGLETIAA